MNIGMESLNQDKINEDKLLKISQQKKELNNLINNLEYNLDNKFNKELFYKISEFYGKILIIEEAIEQLNFNNNLDELNQKIFIIIEEINKFKVDNPDFFDNYFYIQNNLLEDSFRDFTMDEEKKYKEQIYEEKKSNFEKHFDEIINGCKPKYLYYFHRLPPEEQNFFKQVLDLMLNIYLIEVEDIRKTIAMMFRFDNIIKLFFQSENDSIKRGELIDILNDEEAEAFFLNNLDFSNIENLTNGFLQETKLLKQNFPYQLIISKVYGEYFQQNYRNFFGKPPTSLMDFFNQQNKK